mmetsp:Transcript_46159/g.86100  ORF Transcript_46159/g.86100 Transcript_46159/m.86100 type:complete len:304 (+) Transcript_46159:49-960(+)
MAVTNSLRVSFEQAGEQGRPVSVCQAFEELAPFGEIMRLELLPEQPDTVVVSYYDLRCAAQAASQLGEARCSMEPQYGRCSINLPKEAWPSNSILDPYTAHFYDVRVAAKLALQAGLGELSTHFGKAYVAPTTKPSKIPVAPRYLNDLGISEVVWADVESGKDTRTTLKITGLPIKLCRPGRFQFLLEESSLTQYVDVFRTFLGTRRHCGTVLVNAVSQIGVKLVAKFFHGRQWGHTMPAAVSFAVTQGREEVLRKYPLQENCLKKQKMGESTVSTFGQQVVSLVDYHGISEVSTEAGDDAES